MTRLSRIIAARQATAICPECEGSGYFYEAVRVAGEAYDADLQKVECDWCEGAGTIETDDTALELRELPGHSRIAL